MPTFTANDGVNLHYQTHGSKENKPLLLVNCPALFNPIRSFHLTFSNSYTASQAPAKSSDVTWKRCQNATSCSCRTFADMEILTNRGLATMLPDWLWTYTTSSAT
jgi:hypothetical protein